MTNYAASAFFPKRDDKRYHIQIAIMKADASCMQPVECMSNPFQILADPGADITLLTNAESTGLGYNLDMIYENFPVQGISGRPTEFKQIETWVQIGDLQPILAPIGLCTTAEGLYENLLGNKGLLDSGKISATYDNQGVTYHALNSAYASFAGRF